MMFMPRKSPAIVKSDELFFVDFDKPVPQSSLHQAIYKARPDVKAVFHFHSPAVVLLSVVGQSIRPDAQLQRDFLRRRAALYRNGAGRIAGAGRGNGQVARQCQGVDAARTRRRRRRTVDSRGLHAWRFS